MTEPSPLMQHVATLPPRDAYSWQEKVRAIGRELDFRRRVYPGRVAKGQMTQAEADYQTGVMEALLHDYHHWLFGWTGTQPEARAMIEQRVREQAGQANLPL